MNRERNTYWIHFEAEPEGGYTVTVPALPGCVTWGRNYAEAVEKARECSEGFLEALSEAGEPIPPAETPSPPADALIDVPLPARA